MVRKIKPSKEERQAAKPSLDQPDEFLSASQNAFDWMAEHSKLVIGAIATLLVVGIVYSSASAYAGHVDGKASRLLGELLKVQGGRVDVSGAASGEDDDGPVFSTEKEKSQAVRAAAEALVSAYPKHQAGLIGRLFLGRACLELGEGDCAVQAYQEAVSASDDDDLLHNLALLGLGAAQEQKGDLQAASDAYARVADGKLTFSKDQGLYQAARSAIASNKTDLAKGYLERIETDFPESPLKTDANALLESLQ